MEASEQNPFDKEPRNPFNDSWGDGGVSKNIIFVLIMFLAAAVAGYYFISSSPINPVKPTEENNTNTIVVQEAAPIDTLQVYPYALYAFDDGNAAVLWVFSKDLSGKTLLTILNPINKKTIYQATFPYADCNTEKLYLRECLADDIGLYKSRLWLFNDKKSTLLAFNVQNGELIYDHEKFKEKFGAIADGIFKLRAYGIDDIEFFNKQGQEISFFPFSETIGLRESGRFREKETIPATRFFVNDKPGQSNVYATKLKLNKVHGRYYWDYGRCEEYKGMEYFYREITAQKKFPIKLINPILAAQNGSEVILLHDREFGNNEVRYAEAFDVNGNSLWKDSTEVFRLINSSKQFPAKYNPNYEGCTAVFFDIENISSSGIDFKTGKVLWHIEKNEIVSILNSNPL